MIFEKPGKGQHIVKAHRYCDLGYRVVCGLDECLRVTDLQPVQILLGGYMEVFDKKIVQIPVADPQRLRHLCDGNCPVDMCSHIFFRLVYVIIAGCVRWGLVTG